jgi:hypothetical protein
MVALVSPIPIHILLYTNKKTAVFPLWIYGKVSQRPLVLNFSILKNREITRFEKMIFVSSCFF